MAFAKSVDINDCWDFYTFISPLSSFNDSKVSFYSVISTFLLRVLFSNLIFPFEPLDDDLLPVADALDCALDGALDGALDCFLLLVSPILPVKFIRLNRPDTWPPNSSSRSRRAPLKSRHSETCPSPEDFENFILSCSLFFLDQRCSFNWLTTDWSTCASALGDLAHRSFVWSSA